MRFLHLHSSFDSGGKELRAAKLINAFGSQVSHTIVSAQPGALGASSAIDGIIPVGYPAGFPALAGAPLPGRLLRLAKAMCGYDLILTYNWGAMDAVMAHRLFGKALGLPPLVHHEDGFNEDEADGLKPSRNWFRRIALAHVSSLVVPSQRLETIALKSWHQPRWRIRRIANGIDTAAFRAKSNPDALAPLIKRPGDLWLGTLAGLRAVKNLPAMVRAFSGMPQAWQLVILGEGPERQGILDEARRLGLADRVHLPGFVADSAKAAVLFDLFALSSHSEQFPISVIEAMAAGLAVASPAVGDVATMVADANRRFIVSPGDEAGLQAAMRELGTDAELRRSIGAANREKAQLEYDGQAMIAAYRSVYSGAMQRQMA